MCTLPTSAENAHIFLGAGSPDTFDIEQSITFFNNSNKILSEIFLNDWSSSYSSTETPLAQRLAEEYDRSFYFANKIAERSWFQRFGNTKCFHCR